MTVMSETQAAGTEPTAQPRLELQKVYLKDVSLETPNSPEIFTGQWKPEFSLQINTDSNRLADDVYEVILTLTATAKQGEKTGFLIEIQQCGIFGLKGFSKEQLGPTLGAFCPSTLFPYAREAIDSLLVKGGFPPLHLSPINFEAFYQQRMQAQQAQGKEQVSH